MQPLRTSPSARQRNIIFRAFCLFGIGLAGMINGGPVWGLLGVTGIMLAVWSISYATQLREFAREIEEIYPPSREFVPAPLPIAERELA